MIGRPANRYECLTPLYAAAAAAAHDVSAYTKRAVIYNFDLDNGASWQDIGSAFQQKLRPQH
ncbi:MAG: hypothetical protein HRT94_01135 [Alphaproteobacteria bacterium]|nr:hypothetical protein [Alphaproteobacteria bacterium]